jgi:type III secretory pathway component EscV
MKKRVFFLIFILAVLVVVMIYLIREDDKKDTKKDESEENNLYVSEKVIDDCIEDENSTAITNATEEKISPNALLVLSKYYNVCQHTVNEYAELPEEIVNMTVEELEKEYTDWNVIGFSNSEITLYKELDGNCGEHYVIETEDGKIAIYKVEESGNKQLFKTTEISTEFLTETDLIKIENGFEVYGKEALNQILEDFE